MTSKNNTNKIKDEKKINHENNKIKMTYKVNIKMDNIRILGSAFVNININ